MKYVLPKIKSIAVQQMASNKSSGPDGLTSEFLKKHWQLLKTDILVLIEKFYDNDLDFHSINRANVIFIPKKPTAESLTDYRPISVVNLIPKLISKLLANRLAKFLPDLISTFQTGFVRGRQITENFNATRELIQHISTVGTPAVLAKHDFSKVFDSVEWPFLLAILKAREFPERWIKWIEVILSTSSSRALINGDTTEFLPTAVACDRGTPCPPCCLIWRWIPCKEWFRWQTIKFWLRSLIDSRKP